MNLIEQLIRGKVAIINSEGDKNTQRVIKYTDPETTFDVENQGSRRYYYTDGTNWYPSKVLPNGMKAVDAKEFIKEIEGIEHSTEMAKKYNNNSGVVMVPISQYEAEKELRIDAEETAKEAGDNNVLLRTANTELGIALEKKEAKLKELQPFERGGEGWVIFEGCEGWSAKKYEYIGILGKYHFVYSLSLGCKRVVDFTTDNPHKKETVFYSGNDIEEFNNSLLKAYLVVLYMYHDGRLRITIYMNDNDQYHEWPTQIGTDLQAKFDDPNNDKYKSLI